MKMLRCNGSPLNSQLFLYPWFSMQVVNIPGLIGVFSLRSVINNRIIECFLIHVQEVRALVTRKSAATHVN